MSGETHIVLTEKAQIAKQTEIDEQSAEAEENTGESCKTHANIFSVAVYKVDVLNKLLSKSRNSIDILDIVPATVSTSLTTMLTYHKLRN